MILERMQVAKVLQCINKKYSYVIHKEMIKIADIKGNVGNVPIIFFD